MAEKKIITLDNLSTFKTQCDSTYAKKSVDNDFSTAQTMAGADVSSGVLTVNVLHAKTSSSSTTYGAGSSTNVLKSNGTNCYWGTDSNNTTDQGIGANYKAKNAYGGYSVLIANNENKLVPTVSGSGYSNETSKPMNTESFNPFGLIAYTSSSSNRSADAVCSGSTWTAYSSFDLRYSFNCGSTLTSNVAVYIVAEMQSDGQAKLASPYYTQTLPSTADGKIYIYLGQAISTTNINLQEHHPVYYNKDGKIRLFTASDVVVYGDLSDYATTQEVNAKQDDITNNSSLTIVNNMYSVVGYSSSTNGLFQQYVEDFKLSQFTNDAGFTSNTGTVTSVSAGTGLSISGTASTAPTVNIASGYKLPTTNEWNAVTSNTVTSINGLSGGTLTSPITFTGGDGASASKIIMSRTGAGQITDDSTSTLFGWTSANASILTVGSNSYGINLRGSGTRPQYKGSDLALYSDVPSLDNVHLTQNNTVIVGNALTNISGKSLSAYTSQETTVGGYPVIQILKNGSILSEADASSYMAAQTGSSYVPKYNYDNPSYSYLIFSNGTIYKPQWDSTNGLLLYKMNQLAFKSDVPTISISATETQLNVNTAKTITLNGTIWKVGSSSGVSVHPLSTSSVAQVDPLHTYLLVPISSTSGTIGNSSSSLTTFYGTAIIRTPIVSSNGDVSCTLIYRSSATGGITSTTRTGIGYRTAHKVGFYGNCIMLDCGSGLSGGLLL